MNRAWAEGTISIRDARRMPALSGNPFLRHTGFPNERCRKDDAWDVIVVGGGPAGCAAATASNSLCTVWRNECGKPLARGPRIHAYDPESPVWKVLCSQKYPFISDAHACNRKIGPGVFGFNTGHGHVYDVDNTDPDSVTRGLIEGRRMAGQYRDAFAEHHPAFADAFLAATGSLLGVRETRRILGDYRLTLADYDARRSFPDEISRNGCNEGNRVTGLNLGESSRRGVLGTSSSFALTDHIGR